MLFFFLTPIASQARHHHALRQDIAAKPSPRRVFQKAPPPGGELRLTLTLAGPGALGLQFVDDGAGETVC